MEPDQNATLDRLLEAEKTFRESVRASRNAGRAEYFETGPGLQNWVAGDAKLFGTREAALTIVPKGCAALEIGTWKGAFARSILSVVQPKEMFIVDIDFSRLDRNIFQEFPQPIHLVEGRSGQVADQLEDGSLGFVYIDGDHSYGGCMTDLERYADKVPSGGIIGVNDYTHWAVMLGMRFGVARAVNEFLTQGGFKIVAFGLERTGNHDIFLQKD